MASHEGSILRCPDLDGTLSSLAELFAVTPDEVARALPAAAAVVAADPDAELQRAILPALSAVLGRRPHAPNRIHFFHGSCAFEPDLFARRRLLPLSAVLDGLWAQLRDLAPEVAADRFAALPNSLRTDGSRALTYKLRVDTHDDGPNGVLVRDILMKARLYGSSEFVQIRRSSKTSASPLAAFSKSTWSPASSEPARHASSNSPRLHTRRTRPSPQPAGTPKPPCAESRLVETAPSGTSTAKASPYRRRTSSPSKSFPCSASPVCCRVRTAAKWRGRDDTWFTWALGPSRTRAPRTVPRW